MVTVFAMAAVMVIAIVASAHFTATMIATAFMTVFFAIVRHIDIVVPVIAHEIDGAAAGVVFSAVFVPVFIVARWYPEVKWRPCHRYWLNHDGLGINNCWSRKITDIDVAIKAGLADCNRNTDISSHCRYRDGNNKTAGRD